MSLLPRGRVLKKVPFLGPAVLALYNRYFTAEAVTRRNDRRAYDRMYGSRRLLGEYLSDSRRALYDDLADLVVGTEPRSVLDVGAGAGNLLAAIAARLPQARLVGIDYSRAGIDAARKLVPTAELHVHDLQTLELGLTFDTVVCSEVLEHVEHPERAMDTLRRHCAQLGRIVVTVPDGAHDTWEGHVNFWTAEEFEAWAAAWGEVDLRRLDGGAILVAVVTVGR